MRARWWSALLAVVVVGWFVVVWLRIDTYSEGPDDAPFLVTALIFVLPVVAIALLVTAVRTAGRARGGRA